MRIITRLKLAQWLCIAGVALAAVLMLLAAEQVKRELARNERAAAIVSGVTSLRYLSLEYAQGQGERALVQWKLRRESLHALLQREDLFDSKADARMLFALQQGLPQLARHFNDLVLVRRELRDDPVQADVLRQLEARLFGQLMSRAEGMISSAEELARRSREGVLAAQRHASFVAGGFGLLLALTVLGALAMTIRSVANPLQRL